MPASGPDTGSPARVDDAIAIRGPLAEKVRTLATAYGMSPSEVLSDAVLIYDGEVASGYEPGSCLRMWSWERTDSALGQ